MESAQIRSAVRDGLGVGISVGLSGLAFGAAAVAAGLNVAQASALSLIAFTGASQFALTGVVAGGGDLLFGALGAVLLGGRNALYGLRLAETLGVRGSRRAITAHLVIDESTAVASAQPGPRAARAGFWTTGLTVFAGWNLTTLLGALGAASVGDPRAYGLDVVGPAAFLALLWPRLRTGRAERTVAASAAVLAIAATPLLPPGVPVMLAAFAALIGMARRWRDGADGGGHGGTDGARSGGRDGGRDGTGGRPHDGTGGGRRGGTDEGGRDERLAEASR